jgi:tetratricopeptide (TPR) repeat protein
MSESRSFIEELRRRNVFRAGAAYVVLAWLVVQVADILLDAFAAPPWILQAIIIALAIGLPVALVGAWVYELTTEGLKRTEEVDLADSITFRTGRKLNLAFIGILAIAVAIFAIDKFVWQPGNVQRSYSLAVLPFEIVSDDVAPFFAQLSGDLLLLLQRSSQLHLASQDAVLALPDVKDMVANSARLGVRYFVMGNIKSVENGVGLSIALFDGDSGEQVWHRDFGDAHTQTTLYSVARELVNAIDGDPFSLPETTSDPRAYELYLQARRSSSGNDDYAAAEGLYRRALELDPRFSPALAGLCEVLSRRYSSRSSRADYEDAERYCHRAWTIDPHSGEVQRALGYLYQESGLLDRAREAYMAALAVNAGDILTQVNLAATFHEDDPQRAEAMLRHTIKQHPGSPFAYNSLQYLYFKQGRYDEAVVVAQEAVNLAPDDRKLFGNLCANLVLAGRFAEARPMLEQAVERNKLLFGTDHNNLATVYFFEGDFAGAARLYRQAVEVAPEDSLYYRNLGDALYHLEGSLAARPVFEQAIDLANGQLAINPENYDAPGVLLVSYASIGNVEEHGVRQAAYLANRHGDPQAFYDLAVASSRLGDMDAARDFARMSLDAGYPAPLLNADPDIQASGARFPTH